MQLRITAILFAGASLFLTLLLSMGALPSFKKSTPARFPEGEAAETESNLIAVARPPFSPDIFPCSECHSPEDAIDPTPRPVPDHEETVVFNHDSQNRWCLDCHDSKDRDKLHLADGRLISFEESYKLCGQCHGPELRDWKRGIHGKRTGSWSGQKEYLLCAHCHDPHSPAIKQIEPLPPPLRQEKIR